MLNKLKIQSGFLKGKTIISPDNSTTRSTKSIVLGSLFDTLRQDIKNNTLIELFGGSAFAAICAVSEGAKSSHAIEIDKKAVCVMRQNVSSLKLDNVFCHEGDCFEVIFEILKKVENAILYIDPPFNIRKNFEDIYERLYSLIKKLDANKIQMIVFEHISSQNMPEIIGDFMLFKSRKFGKTTLSYYK